MDELLTIELKLGERTIIHWLLRQHIKNLIEKEMNKENVVIRTARLKINNLLDLLEKLNMEKEEGE